MTLVKSLLGNFFILPGHFINAALNNNEQIEKNVEVKILFPKPTYLKLIIPFSIPSTHPVMIYFIFFVQKNI
jgi:hypothetical protein